MQFQPGSRVKQKESHTEGERFSELHSLPVATEPAETKGATCESMQLQDSKCSHTFTRRSFQICFGTETAITVETVERKIAELDIRESPTTARTLKASPKMERNL